MVANSEHSTHVTLGRQFRTPAHPDVLAALGRVHYSFLSLEESVAAILWEAEGTDLSVTRGKMAAEKEKDLKALANRYRSSPDGGDAADVIDCAVEAFSSARELVRNRVAHAHPYTSGVDEHGAYLPGLAYTARDGKTWLNLAAGPGELLDLATQVELAIDPLAAAWNQVRSLPVSALPESATD